MKNQKFWRRLQVQVFAAVLLLVAIIYVAIAVIKQFEHTWLAPVLLIGIILIVLVSLQFLVGYYQKHVYYLCPNCHQTFEPSMKDFVLSYHTPRTRKLTCPHCHQKSYCLELAKEK